jgi:hypothetical protein
LARASGRTPMQVGQRNVSTAGVLLVLEGRRAGPKAAR